MVDNEGRVTSFVEHLLVTQLSLKPFLIFVVRDIKGIIFRELRLHQYYNSQELANRSLVDIRSYSIEQQE